MKKSVLVLLALLTIVPLAQAMAQTPVAAPLATSVQAATAAQFLATLASSASQGAERPDPHPLVQGRLHQQRRLPHRQALLQRLRHPARWRRQLQGLCDAAPGPLPAGRVVAGSTRAGNPLSSSSVS